MTVWIYVDTHKVVSDKDHLKVFATAEAAEAWFGANDPEGVAFEYDVTDMEAASGPSTDKRGAARALAITAKGVSGGKDFPPEHIVATKDEPLDVVNPVAALTEAERAAIDRLRGIYKVGGEEALEKALDELRRNSIKYVRVIAELSNEARK
jgi:hypothetical protein